MKTFVRLTVALIAMFAPTATSADEQATLPFSKAVRVGDMLYLSGELGAKPGAMMLVPGGIGPETRQTMENIKATLEASGSDMDHVVKCLVMLADIGEWAEMNEVYRTYFKPGRYPARSALGASGLALGARVEIECMARVKEDS
nr:Rid family detoxifying hydrolase [Kordiimonas lipolytica]